MGSLIQIQSSIRSRQDPGKFCSYNVEVIDKPTTPLIHKSARPVSYTHLEEATIMVSQWPLYREDWNFAVEENATETIKEAVRAIRGVRANMNVPPSKKAKVYVVSEDEALLEIFEHSKSFFATLGYANEVLLQKDREGIASDAVSAVIPKAAIYMPFADLVDIEKEIERLKGCLLYTSPEDRRRFGWCLPPTGITGTSPRAPWTSFWTTRRSWNLPSRPWTQRKRSWCGFR